MLANENYTDLDVPLRNPTEHKFANYKTTPNGYGYRHNNIALMKLLLLHIGFLLLF